MAADPELIVFFGTECTHCHEIEPIIERVEEELGIEFTKLEVWHNEKNRKKLEELDNNRCGGVPFLINTRTGKFICGGASYEKIKNLAEGR